MGVGSDIRWCRAVPLTRRSHLLSLEVPDLAVQWVRGVGFRHMCLKSIDKWSEFMLVWCAGRLLCSLALVLAGAAEQRNRRRRLAYSASLSP